MSSPPTLRATTSDEATGEVQNNSAPTAGTETRLTPSRPATTQLPQDEKNRPILCRNDVLAEHLY